MNKIATSILETIGYILKTGGICCLIFSFSDKEFLPSLFAGGIMLAIGHALIKWELHIESKRDKQVKHYDYVILIAFGALAILSSLTTGFGSASGYGHSSMHTAELLNQLAFSICLIAFGFNRKSMYSEENTILMADKYRILVDIILHAHRDCRLFENTTKVVAVGASSYGGANMQIYYIREEGDYVKIVMKANHPMWGASELSWKFPKEMDQLEMDRIIKKDNQTMMERKMQSMCDNYNF